MDEIVILNTFNYGFTISAKTVCFFVFFPYFWFIGHSFVYISL